MTTNPVALPADTPVREAAQRMREREIGNVLVLDDDRVAGIVTDRDIVTRAVADRDDLSDCRLRDVCSSDLVTAAPDDDIDTAIERMREAAVRRIAVVEDGRAVGVFTLGDAALEKDSDSALGDISAATSNS
ncbi:CBS domain-containing protein [Amycolatopsis sacchari]|uniref:CBS domain-containing protein n=1 Tax=Amycolatopsis sacchari TaxID=115433 RepID=A0A1I3YBI7_9PSEU|nr:CBS domain-containing protein [Amycolatopsis sacchari]SFK29218.1 CBS domain-containing protein [Amycolatopsis sacchari]